MSDQVSRYRLILLPVSGSEASTAAAHAAMLARAMGATVAILGVIDTSDGFSFSAEGIAAYQRLRTDTQRTIETASAVIRAAGVQRVEHLIMDGVPAEAILEVSDEQGADVIVLGGTRAMLGNTSNSVIGHILQHARCPVVIVPAERKPC